MTTESLCTVMYGANVPSRFIGETSADPACTRDVPSAQRADPSIYAESVIPGRHASRSQREAGSPNFSNSALSPNATTCDTASARTSITWN